MNPRTWVLLAGGLISSVGDQFAAIAYALLAAARGETGFLSAVLAAQLVPTLALSLIGGVVTDLFLRRWMWPTALIVMAGCFLGMAMKPSETVIVTLVAVSSACAALVGPVGLAAARRTIRPESIAELARWRAASQGVSMALGGLLGAVTFALASVSVLFVVDAATFALLAIVGGLVIAGLPDLDAESSAGGGVLVQAGYGFRLLLAPSAFGAIGLVMVAGVMVATSLGGVVVEVFLFRRVLHASAVAYGLAFAAWAAGFALAPLARRSGSQWRLSMPVAAIVMGVALALPVLTGSVVASIVGYVFGGVANGRFNRDATVVVLGAAQADEQGRAAAA